MTLQEHNGEKHFILLKKELQQGGFQVFLLI